MTIYDKDNDTDNDNDIMLLLMRINKGKKRKTHEQTHHDNSTAENNSTKGTQ